MAEKSSSNKNKAASAGKKDKTETITLNLIIIGNHATGKTSIMTQFTQKKFHNQAMSTIGVTQITHKYENNSPYKCQF